MEREAKPGRGGWLSTDQVLEVLVIERNWLFEQRNESATEAGILRVEYLIRFCVDLCGQGWGRYSEWCNRKNHRQLILDYHKYSQLKNNKALRDLTELAISHVHANDLANDKQFWVEWYVLEFLGHEKTCEICGEPFASKKARRPLLQKARMPEKGEPKTECSKALGPFRDI